ncbi:MAG: hypothetical protein ABIW38_13585 [Ferruginibacter sp.]
MKKVILLLALTSICNIYLFAQSYPEGMNYQAVARNLKGEILANQPIALKVALFSAIGNIKTSYFTEVHDVVTSPTGVFSLIIGQGKMENGKFDDVPWAVENIWMEVAIKSKGQASFAVISNSKLLAVPYAYHAITAGRLTEKLSNSPGIPSQTWSLFGNSNSDATKDVLGTTDSVDLVMVTNNRERMRVYANGNIFMKKSLRVGANLTVDSSAYLNNLGGATINYGPFTVERQSPTLLSGTLTVDQATDLNSSLNVDGITDLNSSLNVNNTSPTKLTGALRVDGVTDLNNNLNVNNISPTILTGTLQVDKDASFNEKIKILSTHQTDTSGASPSGALQVGGGAYIGRNLYIGGIAKFGGPAAFGGAVTITDPSESVSTSTGALMIPYGGVGIGKRLNVGGGGLFESTLGVAGITSLTNITQSTAASNGALLLSGGAGIAKNVNIGGTLTTAGAAYINNTLNVTGNDSYIANFINNTGAHGISIQVNAATPSNNNNFIEFRDKTGNIRGVIEGEIESDLINNPDYQDALVFKGIAAGLATADLGISVAEAIHGAVKVVAAATSITVCVGLGICVTSPIPSLIVESGIGLILKIANFVVKTAGVATLWADFGVTIQHKKDHLGITFTSGSGDYAEWLAKKDITETFSSGDVVSMKNGFITKNIEADGKLMVISQNPIVLGNRPQDGMEKNYEKVAFMGQVPVKVLGKVNAGDYILPSGFNKGFGVGMNPDKMKTDDYKKIIGVAWQGSDNDTYGYVNTAVGLNSNDYAGVIKNQDERIIAQEAEMVELKKMINQTNAKLEKLVPGFSDALGTTKPVNPVNPGSSVTPKSGVHDLHEFPVPDNSSIVYFKVTPAQIEEMFVNAEKIFKESGEKVEGHPFWGKIKTDPAFKQTIVDKINQYFDKAIHMHQEINEAKK